MAMFPPKEGTARGNDFKTNIIRNNRHDFAGFREIPTLVFLRMHLDGMEQPGTRIHYQTITIWSPSDNHAEAIIHSMRQMRETKSLHADYISKEQS